MKARPSQRQKLAELGNMERHPFKGIFERYGIKSGYKGEEPTILLRQVRLIPTEQLLTDHLWFNLTKGFQRLGQLERGDVIHFNGRVNSYVKGYRGHQLNLFSELSLDYQLSWPTKVCRPEDSPARPPLPTERWQLITLIQTQNQDLPRN